MQSERLWDMRLRMARKCCMRSRTAAGEERDGAERYEWGGARRHRRGKSPTERLESERKSTKGDGRRKSKHEGARTRGTPKRDKRASEWEKVDTRQRRLSQDDRETTRVEAPHTARRPQKSR